MLTDGGGEAEGLAASGERVGLCSRPAVTGQAVGTAGDVTLDGNEPAARCQDPADLTEPGVKIGPVVDGGQRPHDAGPPVGDGQCLGRTKGVAQSLGPVGETPDLQHHRGGVDGHHFGTEQRGAAGGHARPAADIDEAVASPEFGEADGERGVGIAPAGEGDCGDEALEPRETGVVAVVVGGEGLFGHIPTLTVEPDFKSSALVSESLLSIGEVGARVGLATSAIRYYERRGLVKADTRVSGQRRYRPETVRRLVFIGMLQDAGLDLDEINGILHADEVEAWKAIARPRLGALDAEIERLSAPARTSEAPCSAATTTPPPTATSWAPRSTAGSP